jgi:hypothetical protein
MLDSVETKECLYVSVAFFVCRFCHFVDVLGGRHEVDVGDIAGAAVDPLCRVLLALVDGINQSETRRFALIVFCAGAYLYLLEQRQCWMC